MKWNLMLMDLSKIEDNEKLLRYRRIMIWILKCFYFCMISTVSGLALGLMFGFRDIELVIMGFMGVVCLGLFLPVAFCWSLLEEVETILKERLYLKEKKFSEQSNRVMLKMFFWCFLVVFGPGIIRSIIEFFKGQ